MYNLIVRILTPNSVLLDIKKVLEPIAVISQQNCRWLFFFNYWFFNTITNHLAYQVFTCFRHDVIHRWVYPFAPDTIIDDPYSFQRHNIYTQQNVSLSQSVLRFVNQCSSTPKRFNPTNVVRVLVWWQSIKNIGLHILCA